MANAALAGRARESHVTAALGHGPDLMVAVTDYMRAVPDQVSRFVDRLYT
jgi:hypothetical protein